MKYITLGNTGIKVSPIGFGVLTVGRNQLNLPLEEGADLVRYGLYQGINFFDTAQYYETYPYIRKALEGTSYNPVIVSKCLSPSYKDMEEAIYEARESMNRKVIDIFLLHEVRHNGDFSMRSGAWQCLKDAKAKGHIKAMGISTHHVDVVEAMVKEPDCQIIFPLINKEGLGIRNGGNPGTAEDMITAIKKNAHQGKGIFAMKVFGGGNLTGSYMDCMDFVHSIKEIPSMVIGFGKKEEVDRAIAYAEGTLPKNYTPDISHKKINIDAGDCEGCGTCVTRCPNGAIYQNNNGIATVDHNICLTCGYCAPVCPVRAIIMF